MIGDLLALAGSVFVLLAAVGVVRFRDPLARMHALAKGSTLGVLLLLVGAAVNLRHDLNDITTVVLAVLCHVLTMPPTSNMLSRAVYLTGAMADAAVVDEGAEPLGLAPSPPAGADS